MAGRFVADGVSALSKLGMAVDVSVPTPFANRSWPKNHRWRSFAATPLAWKVDGKTVRRVRYLAVPGLSLPLAEAFTLAASLRRVIAADGNQPTLIHAHTLYPDGLAAAQIAGRIPLVVSIHGADVRPASRSESRLVKSLGKKVLQKAHRVVANSLRTKARICSFFEIDPDRVVVVPPGIAGHRLDAHAISGSLEPSPESPLIMAVGNLVQLKGHAHLIRALAKDNLISIPWALWIVGDGPERKTLETLAADLGLGARVRFLGRVPPESVPGFLKKAQVFALPSVDEGWGVAWAEAQYLGIPAIGCRGQGTEEIIEDSVTGFLVNPGEVDELAERLRQLLSEESLQDRMGKAARRRAKEYDMVEISRELAKIYESARMPDGGAAAEVRGWQR